MPRTSLGLVVASLCSLLGSLGGTSARATDEKQSGAAETLHVLRKPLHEWLDRDIGEKTRSHNRAYADLILAFGLTRAGDADGAKKLLGAATAVLEKDDAAHQCLLALYRHRIEQVLGGKPPVGPLPAKFLAPVTPTGNEGVNAPVKMHHYIVLRAREVSRILDPLEQIDPYLPWTAKGADDPLVARLAPLQDEQDPERFAKDARKLFKDAESSSLETRLRVTTRLAALGPRAGEGFCVELLKGVPGLIREGRKTDVDPTRAGTVALAEQALALAAGLKKPELFKPLVVEAVELIKTERGASRPGTVARLTIRCERGFRVMGLTDEAKAFLKDTAGRLPDAADAVALQTASGKSWADAARTRLAEAGVRRVAGQDAEAAKILVLVREVVLDPPADDRGLAFYRLVAEYAGACGRLTPSDGRKGLGELFTKLGKVPDTYTTATHYSRYHLMILEAVVLGLTSDDF
jgi:hypothetical protein